MEDKHFEIIANELGLGLRQVQATAKLIKEGATIPFIARYRKEATGSLDEVAISAIRDRMAQLEELDKRRESILNSLKERDLLTDDLKHKILAAQTMASLEDIYLPYRPKRRTRATVAKEKGLEPLAKILFDQEESIDPAKEAAAFINREKGVDNIEDALAGARDIIAEWINENQEARQQLRTLFMQKGLIKVKVIPGKEQEGAKYRDYFDYEELAATAPSHRILAIRRGAKEGILSMKISPPEDDALKILEDLFVKGDAPACNHVKEAVSDSYNRLLSIAMETEVRMETKKRADAEAIKVFAENLRDLLLAPPLGEKRILAIDPGFRTGCKLACLDSQGNLIHIDTIYPFASDKEKDKAARVVSSLIDQYAIEAIAIGNGTAGRETHSFIRGLGLPEHLLVVMVNESGASVYSASKVAREEFPDLDVSFRGAISIGRRLMDPLAELVKIDPKSIGVGQYQHDVNQVALKRSLDDVVESCVNAVGVEVNTASEQLLTYVSGIGPQLAKNIVAYRAKNGPLLSREELKNIRGMGPKAFELSAGFLRIRNGKNPLDASAVHPESYSIVDAMARDLACSVSDLMRDQSLRKKIDLRAYMNDKVGLPTLEDIMDELAKPGRDPRKRFEALDFAEGINDIEDLRPGMRIPGVVTNVTAFGAFVDIGVHQDGLVHISQLADHFVKEPGLVVKVNQKVIVTVLDVDLERRRISLSMRVGADQGLADGSQRKTLNNSKKKGKRAKQGARGAFNNPFAKIFRN